MASQVAHHTKEVRARAKVLIYHVGQLGDTIAIIPALRLIRRKYRDAGELYLLHDRNNNGMVPAREVLAESGLVDHFLEYDVSSAGLRKGLSLLGLWRRLLVARFDAVIYLIQCERSAGAVRRDDFFFSFCGIRRKYGFRAFPRELVYPRDSAGMPSEVEHEAFCQVKRLREDGFGGGSDDFEPPHIDLPMFEVENADAWLRRNRKWVGKDLVAFCPWSKITSKSWPAERFIEVGRRLLATGRFEIVVLGGPGDAVPSGAMVEQWGEGLNAAGVFSVLGSGAVLARCRFAFTLDSGPMNLAAAVGTPCVAIFAGTDYPGRFSPLGEGHTILRHTVRCGGCRLTQCPVEGHPCMNRITVEDAWTAVERLCQSLEPRSVEIQ